MQEYTDSDLSAFRRGVVRPSYEEMLDALPDVDVVMVWKLDRLVRRFLEFARVWPMFEEHGVALVSATEPIDTSSAIGRIIVLMLVGFAELESENISIRQRAKHAELRRQGRPSGGGRARYPDEVLVDAARRITGGETLYAVARDWGIKYPSHLGRALRSPRLAGRREGQESENGSMPQIISPEEWEALQPLLARRHDGPGPGRRHLLSGFLYCEQGHRLEGYRKKGHPYYRCRHCGVSVASRWIEQIVTEGVLDRVDSPAVAAATERARAADAETGPLMEQLHADEQALTDLTMARYVERILGDTEFRAAREEIEQRVILVRARLSKSDGSIVREAHGKARTLWEDADLAWRRALVAAVVDRVTIHRTERRGPGLDPNRVEVTLRA